MNDPGGGPRASAKREHGQPAGAFGVDRLSMSFPLRSAPDPALFASDTTHRARPEDVGRKVLGRNVVVHELVDVRGKSKVQASVFVGAAQVNAEWWGKVECDPARLEDPAGCSLLDLEDLGGAAQFMGDLARDYLNPEDDVESWRVRRLDVARDFRDVTAPGRLLWGLLPQRRRHARFAAVWSDPKHRGAQTLWVGSGAGSVRLYDQHEAYADKGAPAGSLRWELEAREWLGHDTHELSVGRLCARSGRIVTMAEDRWEWSRMGTQVTAPSHVVDRLAALVTAGGFIDEAGEWRTLSRAKADRCLGMLVRESYGAAGRECKQTSADYERIKRALGVVPCAQLWEAAEATPVGRLDWDSGQLVAA